MAVLREAILEMLSGSECLISTRKFQNDMTTFTTKDDVLTLLVHLGYLGYDKASETVFIPNEEIAHEFLNAVDGSAWFG